MRLSNRTRFATAHQRVASEKELGMPFRAPSPVGFPWWCQRRRRKERNQRSEVEKNAQNQEEGWRGRLNRIRVGTTVDYCCDVVQNLHRNTFPSNLSSGKYNGRHITDFGFIGKIPNLSRFTMNSIMSTNSIPHKQQRFPFAILQKIVGMSMTDKRLHMAQILYDDATRDDMISIHEDNHNEMEQQQLYYKCINEREIHIGSNMDSTSTPLSPQENKSCEGQPNNYSDKEKWQLVQSSIQQKLTHIVQKERDIRKNEEEDVSICSDNEMNEEIKDGGKNATIVTLHTYQYPRTNPTVTLYGLGISMPKFKAWIAYMLQNHHMSNSTKSTSASLDIHSKEICKYISTEDIELNVVMRKQLRREWFARNLISHRTEVLASYPSNQVSESDSNVIANKAPTALQEESPNQSDTTQKPKRGGFHDLLSVYAERLVSILKEEEKDFKDGLLKVTSEPKLEKDADKSSRTVGNFQESYYMKGVRNQNKSVSSPSSNLSFHLLLWLRSSYGASETNKLLYPNFSKLKEEEQLNTLKHFLNWFRENFPYYYDQCGSCNASFRNDEDANKQANNNNGKTVSDDSDDQLDYIDGTFLGYIYPTEDEIRGKASRTELYRCHKCQSYTRFPRYNSISSIVQYGKGRCGEYSILLYRTLRDLGHHARWVVDWSDHVWVECWAGEENLVSGQGRWIHLDPCEAACDEPLLYQQWGKKQTLIMAFWVPQQREIYFNSGPALFQQGGLPLIEDVTKKYTSNSIEVIQGRREELSNTIEQSIEKVETELREEVSRFVKQKKQLE